MTFWKKQRKQHGDDLSAAWKHGAHKHTGRVCVACKNTRQCQTCMGAGCQDCDYTGRCPVCILWAPTESDDE